MQTFKYKNYDNCYFVVGSYARNKEAMAISIHNDDVGPITTCTIYDDFGMYFNGVTVIKNYSENSNITNFLKKLGIVDEVLTSFPCNINLPPTTKETKDICVINMATLKEYCKEWNYNV